MSKEKATKSFILNDETKVNSYGFRVPNKEIKLTRFLDNPVMLDMHERGLLKVIGRWENIRIEKPFLLADPVFDVDDPEANRIAGKVERGFIRGASIYLHFGEGTRMEKADDGVPELCDTEAFEASIVDIPSNANSIKLCSAPGKVLEDSEVKLSVSTLISELTKENNNQNLESMNNFKLSAPALAALAGVGLKDSDKPEEVNSAIEKLSADLTTANDNHLKEKKKREDLEAKVKVDTEAAALALVDGAILEGKLTATVKDEFMEMAKGNYALAVKVIGGMPGKVTLGSMVNNKSQAEIEERKSWSLATWRDKDPAGLELMAKNEPEEFEKLTK